MEISTGLPDTPVEGMYFEFVSCDRDDERHMFWNSERLTPVFPYSTGPLSFARGPSVPFLALRISSTVEYPVTWWQRFMGERPRKSTVVKEYGRRYIFDPLSSITPSILFLYAEEILKNYREKGLVEKKQKEISTLEKHRCAQRVHL